MTQVLYHGYGTYIEHYVPGLTAGEVLSAIVSFVPLAILLVLLMLNRTHWINIYIQAAVLVSLSLGICGYSTMLTNMPTMILYSIIVVHRQRMSSTKPTLIARRGGVVPRRTVPPRQFSTSTRRSA